MPITKSRINSNLSRIRENIALACTRRNRSPDEVAIVAVTKTVELDTIKNLIDTGLSELGESRAKQLTSKAEELSAHIQRRRNELSSPVRWHMVGHLQRNKVKPVLEVAHAIHSVDSLRLAEEIQSRAERNDKSVDVFLQVNCSQEPQKFGCAVGAAVHLGEMIASMKKVRLVGLMTMGPLSDDPEKARPVFVRLREIFEEMRKAKIGGDDFRHLSMGMSQDYTVAVEEGATILRIGTALFE
jgi:pyridoxal phosphate enzyme (YggS family)